MDILIVESAAKARTLQRYLGDGWKVVATGGHVETLPSDRKKHGKDASKAYWANRPGELPSPPWVWTDRGEDAVREIVEEAGPDATFWIATDPDREGEFIAWCLDRILEPRGERHRVAFQEVTEEAVAESLKHPRGVDSRMVESALVRKFLDRLVGYRASKMANAIVGRGASMGRVQTPTLGFVVDRELEREAHVPIPYFEVHASALEVDLKVRFHERDDPEAWRDNSERVDVARTSDRELAEEALDALRAAGRVTLSDVSRSTRERRPGAPFSTDALLQRAGSSFGWSPQKTSALASQLYEAGHITYIRTDSTRLAASAVQGARAIVKEAWGEDHLGSEGRKKATTGAGGGPVQDAHEAIRPTRMEVEEAPVDDADARRLYRLVRAQVLASQMAPSVRSIVSVQAEASGFERPLNGTVSWRTFAGWEAAWAEFMADVATEPPAIPLEVGADWPLDPATEERDNPLFVEDETKPPPRYRPHSLIKAMKDAGIGRPSTYSRTVEKLEERGYIDVDDGSVIPTERGRAIWIDAAPLYAREDEGDGSTVELFDARFTALMEDRLDRIESGDAPAPATWEEWRDQVRDLHEAARERRNSGQSTPRQHQLLERLLANAPDGLRSAELDDPTSLSYERARTLVAELKEAGVEPAATSGQMDYLRTLVEELDFTEEQFEELTGVKTPEELKTSRRASAAIEELKRLHEERMPPSARQRRFIDDLMEKAGLQESEAARLVGLSSLEELTGGSEGTASALIDALQERVEEAKA